MRNYMATGNGEIGFGSTQQEANEDLYINLCKKDLSNDTEHKFQARRQELAPWLPLPNMLHISGIGCLVYEKSNLTNTKTGKSILISQRDKSIYYHLANLLGEAVSYTDITVVLRPELDQLFKFIAPDFVMIEDLPPIKKMSSINGFEPNVVYTMAEGVLIGVSDNAVGMKVYGDEAFSVVEVEDGVAYIPLLSYIGYRIGYIFDKDSIRPM